MQSVPRLFTQFHPHHYDVHWNLTRARDERIVPGSVTISGEQLGNNHIRLHAHGLRIHEVTVDGAPVDDYSIDELTDELVIPHHTHGVVQIHIVFELSMTDTMHGLYPCYFVHDGVRQELYATQFESHHAREAFPCIDEPEAKATFTMSLTHPANLTALGNMPIATSEARDHHTKLTTFDTTPIMSSYLLAFVVGKLHKKTGHTKRGVEVSIWATPAQPARTLDFALKTASDVIDFYEDYFGVQYPLAKSDHVALPDFSSGAMENWGLITYREVCLLVDPKTSGVSSKHLVASVVAHELAHQWFGNLVTMRWWNNLWLNESFADFVEHIAVDHLYPEWETWLDFILARGIAALRRDAIDGVQSVQVEVHHPDEIATIFDGAIVYGKGARLMKMLRSYVGDAAFRKGLKKYFKTYAYNNTEGDDLWNCLSEASGKDVAGFMNAWITQPGYPVLTVEPDQLSQTQFFIGNHKSSKQKWPILLRAEPNGALPEIFDTSSLAANVSLDQRFNTGDTGHFVTRYSKAHLANLLMHIGEAPTIDRLTLLNDQTLLVRGRYEPSVILIDLLKYYEGETNDAVWDIMSMTLGELRKFVETDEKAEAKLRHLSTTVARETFERLGFDEVDGEPVTDTKLRATVLAMMLYGEDSDVISQTLKRFDLETLDQLPAELRPLIIGTKVKYTEGSHIIDKLMTLYTTTPSAELKEDLVSGITSTRDAAIARHLLASCKDPEIVRPQDVAHWFVYLIRNRHTRVTAWRWLRDNWGWIVETFAGDKSYDEFPRYAALGLVTREQLAEYKQFFEPMLDVPALKRTILMGISEIESRLEIVDEDGPAVREALLNQ